MGSLDWLLELLLIALLGGTLFHAVRLERALRAWRGDRASLGEAIAGFDDSARQAEIGFGRLHSLSSEAAVALSAKIERGAALRDDLAFLVERGEALADRLDGLVRAARPLGQAVAPAPVEPAPAAPAPKVRSKAERDLLLALQGAR